MSQDSSQHAGGESAGDRATSGATAADVVAARRGVVRRRVQPVTWCVLTLVWVMLWGNFSWMNVISGAIVSAGVLVLFPLPPVRYGIRIRPWSTIVLFVRFFIDMVIASIEVAYKACAPWVHPEGRFARIILRGDNDLLCTMVAQMTTLVPGSIVIDIESDGAGRTLLLHIFDARNSQDIERMRQRVQAQEDRVLKALSVRRYPPRSANEARPEPGGARA
ncbi:multicomponent Na+:H+ antiporter subunit E [Kineosphaera limosa]|uniref:Na(+)/H(+) antiporter subunit E n=1 Tax=Kineosphaera limosa NBRC 100340 TaxID=1184609 RepID=K6W6L4_9MICO|nr:Na+/H+ antiporter subunit E [Kineosphaera limosa]NYD98865.1 multicomponent Na+:H+ antiporter subunit E [Kineosphaera limosa]GAB94810.1 Na(+)/H(+) antiporter subunit E [Kineosphaera limosa NBRC 100340]